MTANSESFANDVKFEENLKRFFGKTIWYELVRKKFIKAAWIFFLFLLATIFFNFFF